MKLLKFRPNLVKEILEGRKTITWRLFDDKSLFYENSPQNTIWQSNSKGKSKKVSLNFLGKDKFKKLVKQMIYTMRRVEGVGLAASQIGESISLAVMETRPTPTRPKLEKKGPIVIVNPRIIKYSKEKVADWEGCLSFKNVRGSVPRSKMITVEYYNEKGKKVVEKATGLWARIFQHEIDHLNGIVYIDRVEDTKTIMTLSEFKKRVLNKK